MAAAHKNKVEKEQLLQIISKYESIVDLKKADPKTITAKRKAWIQIANQFNRLPYVRPCNANQIKRFWSNLKARELRGRKRQNDTSNSGDNLTLQFMDSETEEDVLLDNNDTYELCDDEAAEQPQLQTIISKLKNSTNTRNLGKTQLNRQHCDEGSKERNELNTSLSAPPNDSNEIDAVVKAQLTKLELSVSHMHELHQLAVKREQLQIKLLEKQLEDQSLLNKFRLDNEQEIHRMRLKHEQDLHMQRLRYEQDHLSLQQEKIHDVHGFAIR